MESVTDKAVALLELTFVEARDLPKMDMNGLADPFCVVHWGGREALKTKIIKKTRNPTWNQQFKLLVVESQKNYSLEIDVWDYDKMSKNDHIGRCVVDLSAFYDHQEHDLWLPIQFTKEPKQGKEKKKDKKKHNKKDRGQIHVKLQLKSKPEVFNEFWKGIYKAFDVDGDGSITPMELVGLVESVEASMTDEEVNQLFARIDADKSGSLSYPEFHQFIEEGTKTGDPLARHILPADEKYVWVVVAQTGTGRTVGEVVLQGGHSVGWRSALAETSEDKKKVNTIWVHDRLTGKLVDEKIPTYIKVAMRLMYTGSGQTLVEGGKAKSIIGSLTYKQGKKYNKPESVGEIAHFIKFHNINVEEMAEEVTSFKCFNEFFFRKLKASVRPIAYLDDPKIAVCPADCRLNVFINATEATRLWIKGRNFTLASLLNDEDLAKRYDGGSIVIARLAPQDYHRFHFPVTGVVGKPKPIDGTYYTVNPIAVNEAVDVYTENKRVVSTIQTEAFGLVTFVAIGATMVGSIILTSNEGDRIRKGDEHGYFAFGGSTCILLFEKDRILLDEDLVVNSNKPLETLVRMGMTLGRAAQ